MARPLRLQFPGASYHITARGNEKKPIFRSDEDRIYFLSLLGEVVERFKWLIFTYTLMTNHYHLVVETPQGDLSRGMHWLNSRYAARFNRKRRRVGHLFQGRFKSILFEQQTHLNEVLRYTVLNPVRAGMVAHPADYKWSSYNACAGNEKPPAWLSMDWVYALDPDPVRAHQIYRDHVAARIGSTQSLWEELVGQTYLGSPEWVETMRERVESEERSEEHARAQRLLPRASMETVVESVATACEIDSEVVRTRRGGIERMLAAWIGWQHAVLHLREIAVELKLRSASYVSQLIRRCQAELARNRLLRAQAHAALTALRIPAAA